MLLEIENFSLSFEKRDGTFWKAIRDVSFSLDKGEVLGIVGESGCGKSLTSLAIMGLLPETASVEAKTMLFNGLDLLTLTERKRQDLRGQDMAMIFQDPMSALNPCFTVGFQIDEIFKIHKRHLRKKERKELALDLLNQVGIPAPECRIHCFPHELSGGMCQRVMIAMAIAVGPKLLIADEPTTALDVTIQGQIMNLLRELQEKFHMAMILIGHDLSVVAHNSDRIQVMYAGEIVESAPTELIVNTPSHPYSRGLINSLPSTKSMAFREELPSIPGIVPDLRKRPSGCQFHPRCEFAKDDCKVGRPLNKKQGKRLVRCLYPLGGSP